MQSAVEVREVYISDRQTAAIDGLFQEGIFYEYFFACQRRPTEHRQACMAAAVVRRWEENIILASFPIVREMSSFFAASFVGRRVQLGGRARERTKDEC